MPTTDETQAAPEPALIPNLSASTANAIRDKLEDRSVGVGCLGTIVFLLFATYAILSWLFGDGVFALVGVVAAALVCVLVVQVRGYHVWTGVTVLFGLMLAFGVPPLVYGLAVPENVLPAWATNPYWMGPVVLAGLGGLVVGLMSLRRTVSTAEAMYAIQLHAANKQVDKGHLAKVLDAALVSLATSSSAGVWPLAAEFISLGDFIAGPEDAAGEVLVPLLAMRIQTSEIGSQPFGSQPWLIRGEAPAVGPAGMAPRCAGVLYCDLEHLNFVPTRKNQERVKLPLASLRSYVLWVNGFEIVCDGESPDSPPRRYAFATVHAWRLLALVAFLRVFEVDVSGARAAVWARKVRDGMSGEATMRFESRPDLASLEGRLRAASSATRGPAGAAAAEVIDSLLGGDRPPLPLLGGELLAAWESIGRGESEGWTALLAAEGLVSAIPTEDFSHDPAPLLTDLTSVYYLVNGEWNLLLDVLGDEIEAAPLRPVVELLKTRDFPAAAAALEALDDRGLESLLLTDALHRAIGDGLAEVGEPSPQ